MDLNGARSQQVSYFHHVYVVLLRMLKIYYYYYWWCGDRFCVYFVFSGGAGVSLWIFGRWLHGQHIFAEFTIFIWHAVVLVPRTGPQLLQQWPGIVDKTELIPSWGRIEDINFTSNNSNKVGLPCFITKQLGSLTPTMTRRQILYLLERALFEATYLTQKPIPYIH